MKYHLLSAVLIVAAIVLEMAGYGKPGSNWGATLFVAGPANFGFGSALASPKRRGVTRYPAPKSNERPDNCRSLGGCMESRAEVPWIFRGDGPQAANTGSSAG
jgi:hypothetical protein